MYDNIKLLKCSKKSILKLSAHRESLDPFNCTPPAENRSSRLEQAFPHRTFPTMVSCGDDPESQFENYERVVNHGIPSTAHPRLKIA